MSCNCYNTCPQINACVNGSELILTLTQGCCVSSTAVQLGSLLHCIPGDVSISGNLKVCGDIGTFGNVKVFKEIVACGISAGRGSFTHIEADKSTIEKANIKTAEILNGIIKEIETCGLTVRGNILVPECNPSICNPTPLFKVDCCESTVSIGGAVNNKKFVVQQQGGSVIARVDTSAQQLVAEQNFIIVGNSPSEGNLLQAENGNIFISGKKSASKFIVTRPNDFVPSTFQVNTQTDVVTVNSKPVVTA